VVERVRHLHNYGDIMAKSDVFVTEKACDKANILLHQAFVTNNDKTLRDRPQNSLNETTTSHYNIEYRILKEIVR